MFSKGKKMKSWVKYVLGSVAVLVAVATW
jgi:phage shock protein E